MIINHNLNAMTAHRQMGINTGNQGKAIEKLSSGQRINRAGDDAAGLAISEKMRGQIRGLEGASRNAQDGVSMIQTAEGALNETHNILQRMRELAVQGANDTNVTEDREAIQKEMDALMEEIDRISTDTEFNGQKLLNGDFKDKKLQIGANTNQSVKVDVGTMDSDSLLEGGFKGIGTSTVIGTAAGAGTASAAIGGEGTYEVIKNDDGSLSILKEGKEHKAATAELDVNGDLVIKNGTTTVNTLTIGAEDVKNLSNGGSFKFTVAATGKDITVEKELSVRLDNISKIEWDGTNLSITGTEPGAIAKTYEANYSEGKLIGFTNTGDDSDFVSANDLGLNHEDLVKNFTINVSADEKTTAIDVSTHDKATKSVKTIDEAINKVSSQRADLGALQNRLEHTIATNDNSAENLQAAESRIRDVDMAKEMMNLSKNNVLVQAAQSMLAQANQQPNQVLSLLR